MYPKISLKIENHIPTIIYYPDADTAKKMTEETEDLYTVVMEIAKQIGLIEDYNKQTKDLVLYDELLSLARESNEVYLSDYPDINVEEPEFNLTPILKKIVDDALKEANSEMDLNTSDEVKTQLKKNLQADIFASALEVLYMILIGKTLVAASELGVGSIALEDYHKNPRLVEKMGRELDNLGVEFEKPGQLEEST